MAERMEEEEIFRYGELEVEVGSDYAGNFLFARVVINKAHQHLDRHALAQLVAFLDRVDGYILDEEEEA